jgi:hypothetical protein
MQTFFDITLRKGAFAKVGAPRAADKPHRVVLAPCGRNRPNASSSAPAVGWQANTPV